MALRDPRAAAAVDDDSEHTAIATRRAAAPRFVPAETVMPTVSYRAPLNAARVPAPRGPERKPPMRAVAATPPAVRVLPSAPVAHDPEHSVVEHMPTPPRAHAAPPPVTRAAPHQRGELTVVFSCRGGSGATTLAVNTAGMFARQGRSVCVVDLDLQLGDVCVALDLESQTSLSSVAREVHLLDAASLRRRLAQHNSGICALTQAGHLDDLDPTLAARMPTLLDTLRTHFAHVVVDGVRDFGDAALVALEAATTILVVVTQDVPSVRRAARVLALLGRLEIPEQRCRLVVNRAIRRAAIDDAAIERALGMKIAVRVREDARVADALDAGAPLIDVARSRAIVDDLARVAALCQPGAAAPPARRFRVFGRRHGGS